MRITVREPAPDGSTYAADAWTTQIGRTVPLRGLPDRPDAVAVVVDAEVVDDGAAVLLELALPDLAPEPVDGYALADATDTPWGTAAPSDSVITHLSPRKPGPTVGRLHITVDGDVIGDPPRCGHCSAALRMDRAGAWITDEAAASRRCTGGGRHDPMTIGELAVWAAVNAAGWTDPGGDEFPDDPPRM